MCVKIMFSLYYADGIPNDGIPLKDTVTVAIPLTVMFILLATAGLVFTIVCLAFNFIFRNKKYVSSTVCCNYHICFQFSSDY